MTKKVFLLLDVFIIILLSTSITAQTYVLSRIEYKRINQNWFRIDSLSRGDQIFPHRILAQSIQTRPITLQDFVRINIEHVTIEAGPLINNWYILKIEDEADPFSIATMVESSELFSHLEFDGIGMYTSTSNDPLFTQQWNLQDSKLRMSLAWMITKGIPSVVVSIIDSGVEITHEDLYYSLWNNPCEIPANNIDDDLNGFIDDIYGWDFVTNTNIVNDELGHGTSVAGIIGSRTDNNLGLACIAGGDSEANGIRMMVIKVTTTGSEPLFASRVAQAIEYAANNQSRIINLSLGFRSNYAFLLNAVDYATNQKNCVLIAAVGNDGNRPNGIAYPAKYNNVIAVGATDDNDLRWIDFENTSCGSEFGPALDLMAPGGDFWGNSCLTQIIWSTKIQNEYRVFGGTSAAAPHVSGLAALILSLDPTYSLNELKRILETTSKDLGITGRDDIYGNGRVDGFLSLLSIQLRPQNLSVSIQNNRPVLSWSSFKNAPTLLTYKIWRALPVDNIEPQEYQLIATTTQQSFTDNNVIVALPQNTLVRYRVSAVYDNVNYNQGNGELETGKSNSVDVLAGQIWVEKSKNSGWVSYGLEGLNVDQLVILNQMILTNTRSQGLWARHTTDLSSGWEFIGFSDTSGYPGPLLDIFIQNSIPPKLYVALGHGHSSLPSVLFTTDLGSNWQALEDNGITSQDKGYTLSFLASDLYPGTLFRLSHEYLYRSTNAGVVWNIIRENCSDVFILDHVSGGDEMLWTLESTPFFERYAAFSTDYGESWTEQYPPPGGTGTNWTLNVIERVPNSDTIYAGACGFWKSTNSGLNWNLLLNRCFTYAGIIIDPDNPYHIISGGGRTTQNTYSFYESFDGGATWDSLNNFPDTTGVSSLVFDYQRNILYAGAKKNWGSLPDGLGGVFMKQIETSTGSFSNEQFIEYELLQNFPNPFNGFTTISYITPDENPALLTIYDIIGRVVKRMNIENKTIGRKTVSIDASDLPSGVYIYSLNISGIHRSRKMILLK